MLKRDFDQQRVKVIDYLEKQYAYWEFQGDLFDKPKKRLMEFYRVTEDMVEHTEVIFGKISKSMEPKRPFITLIVHYQSAYTHIFKTVESIELYNILHKDPEIKRR